MDKKTIILSVGLTILLISGLVIAVQAVNSLNDMEKQGRRAFHNGGCMNFTGEKPMNKTALFEELGLPENATREQIDDAIWSKQLSDLGLTEDSTLREYRQAIKTNTKTEMGQMKQWRKENKGMLFGEGCKPGSCGFKGMFGERPLYGSQ